MTVKTSRMDWLRCSRGDQENARLSAQGMRLLYLATSEGQGGIERHSVRLAQRLQDRGACLTYACRPGSFLEKLCQAEGIPVLPLAVRNSGDLRAVQRLMQHIIRHRVDLVHVHSRRDFVVATLAVAGVRLWLRPHGRRPALVLHAHLAKALGSPARLSGRLFEWGSDAVVAVSEVVRLLLIDVHEVSPALITTIPNGVDLTLYDPSAAKRSAWRVALRGQWGIPRDAVVVGMVGRLDAKGQKALLSAAPLLLARFPHAYFVFVGPEGDAGSREDLRRLAETGRFPERLILPGPSESIPACLAAFDILAHLPAQEAFGLSLVEAMAMGVPVVATAIGGCVEVVEEGVTGLLVPLGDQGALVAALSCLLDEKGALLAANLRRAGRRHARSLFSLTLQVETLEILYTRLLLPPPSLLVRKKFSAWRAG